MKHRVFLVMTGVIMLTLTSARSVESNQPPRRPNILIIMTDQQIADGYSAKLGNKYIHTPALDTLAEHARVYDRAYAANPICVPSRTSIWSGRYPHETGIETNDRKYIDARRFPTIGTAFATAGYETAYVGKWHAAYPVDDVSQHGFEWTDNMKNNGNGLDAATPAAAARFLQREHARPWLLVVSFNYPHNICEWARGDALPDGGVGTPPPLAACPPLVGNSMPPRNELVLMAQMRASYQASRMCTPVGTFGEKEWREYLWAYYRMIEKVDHKIGEVYQALQDSGQLTNTLVVFTSDHGDMIGAHQWNQKTVFFEESVRVPLFLSMPGTIQPGRTNALVNTGVDLFPTLCDIAGIPTPANLPGNSLLADAVPRTYIVVENHMVQGAKVDGQKPQPNGRMVRSARCKYCVYDMGEPREELYDTDKDPGEMVNQAANPEYKAVLLQHRAYLKEWAVRHGDDFPVPEN